ncbi:hypothetical protein HRbin41_00320 [bacterium HR41]|nr:hypothetical protein HRbin41_00320 [bacterium HR41]
MHENGSYRYRLRIGRCSVTGQRERSDRDEAKELARGAAAGREQR